MDTKKHLLSRLDKVRGNGTRYRAKCPAREHRSGDNTLSLLFHDDGRILIHCHAGCEALDVLGAVGLSLSDLYPDGAIRDFMASASTNNVPNQGSTDAWIEVFERQRSRLKPGERMSDETMKLARKMYTKRAQENRKLMK